MGDELLPEKAKILKQYALNQMVPPYKPALVIASFRVKATVFAPFGFVY